MGATEGVIRLPRRPRNVDAVPRPSFAAPGHPRLRPQQASDGRLELRAGSHRPVQRLCEKIVLWPGDTVAGRGRMTSDPRTVVLDDRSDINLRAVYRVAWQRRPVTLSAAALAKIASSRANFLEMIEKDPSVVIYGVTTSMGERAHDRLSTAERDRHAQIKPFAAATSFGENLPDRIVRGIVLARPREFHRRTTRPPVRASRVRWPTCWVAARCRRWPPTGRVAPARFSRCIRCSPSCRPASCSRSKERGSLINGSPCAAALLADAALAARRRLRLALQTFALSIEAFRAPPRTLRCRARRFVG